MLDSIYAALVNLFDYIKDFVDNLLAGLLDKPEQY